MDENKFDEKKEIKNRLEHIIKEITEDSLSFAASLESLKDMVRKFPRCTKGIDYKSVLSPENFETLLLLVSKFNDERGHLGPLKFNELTVIVDKKSSQDGKQEFCLNKHIEIKHLVFSFRDNVHFNLYCKDYVSKKFDLTLNKNKNEEQFISLDPDIPGDPSSFDLSIKTDVDNEEQFSIEASSGSFHGLFIKEIKNIKLLKADEDQLISIKSNKNIIVSHFICLPKFKIEGDCTISHSYFEKELSVMDFRLSSQPIPVLNVVIRKSKIKTLKLYVNSKGEKIHFENCSFSDAPFISVDGEIPPHNFSFHNCEFEISKKSLTASNNFRKMSKVFKQLDNNIEFLRFQAYEHKCRPPESYLEKVTGFLYGFFNNYGLSFSRPLCLLLSLFFICSIIFYTGFKLNLLESLKFSFTNTFVFIRWIAPEGCTSTLCEGWGPEECISRVCDTWIYIIGILQSITSAVLLYLFIVGVRIRFKIKS